AAGGGGGGAAFGGVGEGVEREGVLAGEEDGEVLEVGFGPGDGGEELGGADAAVVVGVEEGEGFLVELEALHGAGEGGPEFLVEGMKIFEVGGGGEGDLVETAD